MEYEHDSQMVTFVSGLVVGALIGAGIALLSAPQSGRRTRKQIRRAAGNFKDNAEDRWDRFSEEVKGKVDEAIKGAKKALS